MRVPRSLLAGITGAGLLMSLISASPALAKPAGQHRHHHVAKHQKVAIPAYWGPDTDTGAAMFDRLAQSGPTNDLVVINGSQSKPETPFNPAWARAVARMHDVGQKVLAYVDTGYYGVTFPPYDPRDTRPDGPGGGSHSTAAWTAQIEADIDGWYDLYGSYGIDGIFLDETTEPCGTDTDPNAYANLYAGIRHYIAQRYPHAYVIINPGVPVDQCYEKVADTILTFEGTYSDFMSGGYGPPKQWQLDSRHPDKFWNLVYDVPDASAMQTVIARLKQQNVGRVFVTDDKLRFDDSGNVIDFPWDTIPGYWNTELDAAAGHRTHHPAPAAVSAPSSVQPLSVTTQTLAIPTYFDPHTATGQQTWSQLDQTAPAGTIGVMDVTDSGPGSSSDPTWVSTVSAAQAHGIKILCYIETKNDDGSLRPQADVEADIPHCLQWYHPDGIFFDETGGTATGSVDRLAEVQALYADVKAQQPGALVVLNPGENVSEQFAAYSDIICIFEGPWSGGTYNYRGWTPDAWVTSGRYPAQHFWNLVYSTTTSSSMRSAVSRSKSLGIGNVYVTDEQPSAQGWLAWNRLPSYWTAEITALHG